MAGQIGRLGKLLVGGAELGDEPVLIELDRRVRHLLGHAVAEKEDVLRGRRHVAGALGHPLKSARLRQRGVGSQFAGLLGEIDQDRPGLDQGQRLAVRTLRVDQGRDAAGRVDLQVIRLFLVALRQVQNMDLAGDAAFVDRDRGALPVAGAGGVKLHRRVLRCVAQFAASYRSVTDIVVTESA